MLCGYEVPKLYTVKVLNAVFVDFNGFKKNMYSDNLIL